jgi:hypothetical protein
MSTRPGFVMRVASLLAAVIAAQLLPVTLAAAAPGVATPLASIWVVKTPDDT